MLRTRYRAHTPSTTKLWRGICQRLTGTESFFHHIFCCTVFNGPNFLTAKSYLHLPSLCLSPPSPWCCFQFHLPLQYGRHLRLLLISLLLLLRLLHLFLGITVLLYWPRCFLLYLDFLLKRLICCKQSAPDQEHAVPRFTENSVSFSSPSQAPSSPQDQPQDQPPDHPPPPPPLPLKQKHWNTVYVNTQNTTLNATADLH